MSKKIIKCRICGEEIKARGFQFHTAKHGLTLEEYKQRYGWNPIEENKERKKGGREEEETSEVVQITPKKLNRYAEKEEKQEKTAQEVENTKQKTLDISSITFLPRDIELFAFFDTNEGGYYSRKVVATGIIESESKIPTVLIIADDGTLVPPSLFPNFIQIYSNEEVNKSAEKKPLFKRIKLKRKKPVTSSPDLDKIKASFERVR